VSASLLHFFVRLLALGDCVASQCACYSWRLPPHRWVGDLWHSVEARKEVVRSSREGIVRGIVLTPREM
jgi:hypothetical protein